MSVIIGTKVCTILATLLKSNICRKKKMWVFNFANRDINVISWVKKFKDFKVTLCNFICQQRQESFISMILKKHQKYQ